jgi:hypothetical protein
MGNALSITLPIMSFCGFQAQSHHFDIVPGSLSTLLRLLLKAVKDIDGGRESHRINGPVGVAIKVIDCFQNAPTAETFERLDGRVSSPFWASLIATPMTRRTSSGNARKSSLDDPIHSTGLCSVIEDLFYSI